MPASKASAVTMHTPNGSASDAGRLAERRFVNQNESITVAGIPQTTKRMPVEYIKLCQSGVGLWGLSMAALTSNGRHIGRNVLRQRKE
jgi:hypothetical protein